MRFFFTVIFGTILLSCRSLAQEVNIAADTSDLQDVLTTLKQSVNKLSLDNNQLAARDNVIKQHVSELQTQLAQLESQGDLLNKSVAQLQDKNPRRAQQITQLEKENFDLDNNTQKAMVEIKSIQESLEAGYEEDRKLYLQLKGMTITLAPSSEYQAAVSLQNEKLNLMKMVYDSKERQKSLNETILDFQKESPMSTTASASAHQQLLKAQIKDLEAQMAAYPSHRLSVNEGFANQTDQLRQLEWELKGLEKNYAQLKNLTEQMSKKAQASPMTASQRIESEKLQGSLDDLKRQGKGLKNDLDNLRFEMVDLDKRKSRLEIMAQQLP